MTIDWSIAVQAALAATITGIRNNRPIFVMLPPAKMTMPRIVIRAVKPSDTA